MNLTIRSNIQHYFFNIFMVITVFLKFINIRLQQLRSLACYCEVGYDWFWHACICVARICLSEPGWSPVWELVVPAGDYSQITFRD